MIQPSVQSSMKSTWDRALSLPPCSPILSPSSPWNQSDTFALTFYCEPYGEQIFSVSFRVVTHVSSPSLLHSVVSFYLFISLFWKVIITECGHVPKGFVVSCPQISRG